MRMNVVTSLNNKYTRYACVMLTSLFETQSKANEIHIFILHSGLTEQNKSRLSECVENYSSYIHFFDIDDSLFSAFPSNENWTNEAYYRLLLLDMLPKEVDRLLYLDVDVIVNKELDEMYFSNFDGAEIIAQAEAVQPPFGDVRDTFFAQLIEHGNFCYCNSGVALWNVEAMRGKYNFQTYIDKAKELDFKLIAPDQDLLNLIHQEHMRAWDDPAKYGLFARKAYNNDIHYEEVKKYSSIIHFVGPKPWWGQFVHYDIEQLWWDYAKKTPLYHELQDEFMDAVINNPLIFNSLQQSMTDKENLKAELDKSIEINKKLLSLLERK